MPKPIRLYKSYRSKNGARKPAERLDRKSILLEFLGYRNDRGYAEINAHERTEIADMRLIRLGA